MEYIKRALSKELKLSASEYPIVAVIGPRQTGKTTLVKNIFPKKEYISLENIDNRAFAGEDPNGFLEQYKKGAIFDEIQRVPEIFSYLQTEVDRDPQPGRFILTGSHQYQLHENISQSLAGRVSILKLLPLSYIELIKAGHKFHLNDLLFTGFYPRIHSNKIRATKWLSNYVETYIDKDVRLIKNIENLTLFTLFLKMCAARVGQLINLESIGNDVGISQNTVKSWLSVLESSFIVKRLYSHHSNFNKRLIKTPKLYFYDIGLLCNLLGISNVKELEIHSVRGGIFENFVIMEITKQFYNQGKTPPLFFWRDKNGHEIDCIIELNSKLTPIEIKSGQTVNDGYFKNLAYWTKLSQSKEKSYLIYSGAKQQLRTNTLVLPWKDLEYLFKSLKI